VRPVGRLEQKIKAVTLIPGSTEFGYEPATVVQTLGPGQSAPENRHISYASSDIVASLDELQALAPNLERVAVVVAWFGTDLRCGQCRVVPGVDSRDKQTFEATWSVAGVDRSSAYLVSRVEGRPAFGGTPSDDSVRHLIGELKARGLKVTLYPFVMMDIPTDNALVDPRTGAVPQPPYPWRGRITSDPAPGEAGTPDGAAAAATQVNAFFSGGPDAWNYNTMVMHYASLAADAGGVDAFLIGSELAALTRVRSAMPIQTPRAEKWSRPPSEKTQLLTVLPVGRNGSRESVLVTPIRTPPPPRSKKRQPTTALSRQPWPSLTP
jgi:hypothetical protein